MTGAFLGFGSRFCAWQNKDAGRTFISEPLQTLVKECMLRRSWPQINTPLPPCRRSKGSINEVAVGTAAPYLPFVSRPPPSVSDSCKLLHRVVHPY